MVTAGALFVAAAAVAGADAGDAPLTGPTAAESPNQSLTPLWPSQAPILVSLDVYEPSLHNPVDPAGTAAGPCANDDPRANKPVTRTTEANMSFIANFDGVEMTCDGEASD